MHAKSGGQLEQRSLIHTRKSGVSWPLDPRFYSLCYLAPEQSAVFDFQVVWQEILLTHSPCADPVLNFTLWHASRQYYRDGT